MIRNHFTILLIISSAIVLVSDAAEFDVKLFKDDSNSDAFYDLDFMSFLETRLLPLIDGSYVEELACENRCEIMLKEVNCSRKTIYSWNCSSSSLVNSNYLIKDSIINCTNVVIAEKDQNPCFFRYSIQRINKGFDFTILLFVMLALVLLFMLIELLKKFFNCSTPNLMMTNRDWSCRSQLARPLPLRTAFSTLPPEILIQPLRLDLSQDFKGIEKSSFKDNYI